MARMHSNKKGKSGSNWVDKSTTSTTWIKYSAQEIEKLVIKEAKEGLSPSQIGLRLRDTYGVPNVEALCSKKITQIIKENNLSKTFPEDLMTLFKKAVQCSNHLKKNNHDRTAERGLVLTRSKINRLLKYYKRNKIVDENFRFDVEQVKLLVE